MWQLVAVRAQLAAGGGTALATGHRLGIILRVLQCLPLAVAVLWGGSGFGLSSEVFLSAHSKQSWSSLGHKCCSGGSIPPAARHSGQCLGSERVHEQEANSLFLGVEGLCADLLEVCEGLLLLQWALNLTPDAQLTCSTC